MSHSDETAPHDPVYAPQDPSTVHAIPPELEVLPPGQPQQHPTPRTRQRRKRTRHLLIGCFQWLRAMFSILLMALAAIIGAVAIVALVIYNSLAGELAEDMAALERMEGVEDFQSTRIYDRDGNPLYEVFEEGRRTEVPLGAIPQAVQNATVATEDDTFYDNPGFDPPSIARAAWDWVRTGEIQSGGSTITQQLIRQIVFTYEERNEQTLRRKLKEAALAWVMTQRYSKEAILEIYLNEVYYGNLAYGIEGAANVYFDKPASELTIAESAFLAGLVQSPATYDPYVNFEAAKSRQRQVLDLMVAHGLLPTASDADAAFAEPPLSVDDLASPDVSLVAPHFTVAVRHELEQLPGVDPEAVARGGLRIYTSLSQPLQRLAEEIVRAQVAEIGKEANLHNAALVAINPNTGEVLAMVGSLDYYDESIDGNVNVILSPQQPGSAMKPLTYAAAFERGWTAADILWDVPLAYSDGVGGQYNPVNYDRRFHGPVRLRDALANSYNLPAVELLEQIGVPALLEISHRFGIASLGDDASRYGLALTLGGGDLMPIELASAYAVFANGGHRITPHLVTRVVDSTGEPIYEAPGAPGEEVLNPRIAFLISDILSDNAARTPMMGAESPLLLSFPAAAKTGTTNDYRDNWTVGYTPHLVVGVWAGNTDNSQMAEGTSGLTGAAPIWHEFMEAVYADPELVKLIDLPGLPPLRTDFMPPAGMEQRQVCVLSSLRDPIPTTGGCPRYRAEWFAVLSPEQIAQTPSVGPTLTWTPRPTVEGQPAPGSLLPVSVLVEPGIWSLGVLPVNEERLNTLRPLLDTMIASRPPNSPALAPPRYCEVPQEYADIPEISYQLFIAAPPDPADAIRARNWALEYGVPIVPGIRCSIEIIQAQLTPAPAFPGDVPAGTAYSISSPAPGQGVYGDVAIWGTVLFDPLLVQYYKIEISGGQFGGEWLTVGDIHSTMVNNGQLEILHALALAPGNYILRLVLVKMDGNYVQPTYDVPITVLTEPPTATPTPTEATPAFAAP